jgi:hypothetical protein
LYYVELVTRCLSLMRCVVNFVIVAMMQYDFRKTLRRTFCCCCSTTDDIYYEPVVCCRCRSSDDTDDAVPSKKSSGNRAEIRKNWTAVSSLASTSSSSRKQDNNSRGIGERKFKSPRPSAGDVVGDVSTCQHVVADQRQSGYGFLL